MSEPTKEELLARIADLERQAAQKKRSGGLSLKVSEKGAVSVYGMGRFPVTLYYEQWKGCSLLRRRSNIFWRRTRVA